MKITTKNYFDQVKKVDFSKVPPAMSKSHDLVKKVGTGSEPWANYRGSEPIRNMIDKYFDVMEKYLAANPQYQVAAPKAAKPAPAPKAAKPAPAPKPAKPAAAPKAASSTKFRKFDKVQVRATGDIVTLLRKDKDGWHYQELVGDSMALRDVVVQENEIEHAPKAAKPTKAAKPAPTPKAPKAPKAKKVKPVDTRDEVPHLSAEVQYVRPFLRLVGKPVTLKQVQALHRKLEKDITKRSVRVHSKHGALLEGIAATVASLYEKMTEKEIGSIEKLEFTSEDAAALVVQATALVNTQRVGTATTLLSAFINMQGTVPTEKAVANLQKKLANEYDEHPNGDFALAVGAADAVLRDWKPGQTVRITKQQLSGLSGLMALGCPDTPAKPCGCGPKKARR
jgi:hypothetical protein